MPKSVINMWPTTKIISNLDAKILLLLLVIGIILFLLIIYLVMQRFDSKIIKLSPRALKFFKNNSFQELNLAIQTEEKLLDSIKRGITLTIHARNLSNRIFEEISGLVKIDNSRRHLDSTDLFIINGLKDSILKLITASLILEKKQEVMMNTALFDRIHQLRITLEEIVNEINLLSLNKNKLVNQNQLSEEIVLQFEKNYQFIAKTHLDLVEMLKSRFSNVTE